MSDSKTGPLTVDDLITVWTAAVDPSYGQAFLAAGEGGSFEAYTQGFAQTSRVSTSIDVSTQAQYILPASGQSDIPAMGEQKATVQLSLSRTLYLDRPVTIGAGLVWFGEEATDWSATGPIAVQTGRLYTLQEDLVFLPGDSGPFVVTAVAAGPGWGYNNPLIGTITAIQQVGSGFNNDLAAVTVTTGATPPAELPPPAIEVAIISQNQPDTFVPEHIGQYVSFTDGANVGTIARMTVFAPPQPPLFGSTIQLEDFVAFEAYAPPSGTFLVGERVLVVDPSGPTVVGNGVLKAFRSGAAGHTKFGFVIQTGAISQGNVLEGLVSNASADVDLIHVDPAYTAEAPSGGSGGASWQVLDWVNDLGLTVTNTTQPTGGMLGYLDAIGYDRNIPRLPNENPPGPTTDNLYRKRIWQIADVVTPNAVIRALYRLLSALPFCFREVGALTANGSGPLLPGFFYDGNGETSLEVDGTFTPDAYDYDVLLFDGSEYPLYSDPVTIPGTFDILNTSSIATGDPLEMVAVGDQVEFDSQPGVPYIVTYVSPSQISITPAYTGTTDTTAIVTVATPVVFVPWPIEPAPFIVPVFFDVNTGDGFATAASSIPTNLVIAGDEIEFSDQPGTLYLVTRVYPTQIFFSPAYTGSTDSAAVITDAEPIFVQGRAYEGGFQEPVEYRDAANNVKASGYFGSINGGTLTMIRKKGQGTLATPVVYAAGDYVIGMVSGAKWGASDASSPATAAQYRFSYYLDYTDFRAMFLIGLPRLDDGEFGFAWGDKSAGWTGGQDSGHVAYDDVIFGSNFYDGYPIVAAQIYKSVYAQISRIKAGGVSFYLYQEDGTCS
jgi:hypothetical protein